MKFPEHYASVDPVLATIADYVCQDGEFSENAYATARLCLLDSLGCAILALNYSPCARLIGPVVPGAVLQNGARVPGTDLQLDPVHAAFCLGTMIRWLDYNDTWLAEEWGHPSDNFGAIIAVSDYLSRNEKQPFTCRDVLHAAIQAYEIQGVLSLKNAFNRVGLDHVLLVRVASTAVTTRLLGGSRDQVLSALSQAWLDGGALRTYRHAPNTGSRKSWAAGDACSRAVRLALMTMSGEMGYTTPLSTEVWGYEDVLFGGKRILIDTPLESYTMENILFKISYPAEFHAQTAVEAAIVLHPLIHHRLEDIERVEIETTDAAVRIINKTGPLTNPAARDHCLQYMVAIGLIDGQLRAEDYEDQRANDPRVAALRSKMEVRENRQFSADYLDPDKRAIPNALRVWFNDETSTERIEISYPLGHRRRRSEGKRPLLDKARTNLKTRFSEDRVNRIMGYFEDASELDSLSLGNMVELFLPQHPEDNAKSDREY